MKKFNKTVPFDPGYSKTSFSFAEQISCLTGAYNKTKAPHQKKFQLNRLEPLILDLINKSVAFYLGCMLWGGFIHERFKREPKEILGNSTKNLSEKELQEIDCSAEAKFIFQYIESFDRDCKYFLKKPANISAFIPEILRSYVEFANINKNFVNINKTDEIKLPGVLSHFGTLTNNQLDALCEKIYEIIDSGKIETLLELGFYKNSDV
ncbi:MAG: hypothetical protein WCY19_03510 [Candidatus Gastranaerophilaceae bacterium]